MEMGTIENSKQLDQLGEIAGTLITTLKHLSDENGF